MVSLQQDIHRYGETIYVATNTFISDVHCWWEKSCSMAEWENVAVPPTICLPYVDTAQQYRCTVDGESVTLNLQGTTYTLLKALMYLH